jgi:hypothetical protein
MRPANKRVGDADRRSGSPGRLKARSACQSSLNKGTRAVASATADPGTPVHRSREAELKLQAGCAHRYCRFAGELSSALRCLLPPGVRQHCPAGAAYILLRAPLARPS